MWSGKESPQVGKCWRWFWIIHCSSAPLIQLHKCKCHVKFCHEKYAVVAIDAFFPLPSEKFSVDAGAVIDISLMYFSQEASRLKAWKKKPQKLEHIILQRLCLAVIAWRGTECCLACRHLDYIPNHNLETWKHSQTKKESEWEFHVEGWEFGVNTLSEGKGKCWPRPHSTLPKKNTSKQVERSTSGLKKTSQGVSFSCWAYVWFFLVLGLESTAGIFGAGC